MGVWERGETHWTIDDWFGWLEKGAVFSVLASTIGYNQQYECVVII